MRLLKAGFRPGETMIGMVSRPETFAATDDPRIVPMTADLIDEWLEVQARGWNLPPAAMSLRRRDILARLECAESITPDFAARVDGRLVAAAGLRVIGDYALLASAVVLPEHRGCGIYRALVNRRMRWLREHGVKLALVHCVSDTSAPICLKVGMRPVCELRTFVHGA